MFDATAVIRVAKSQNGYREGKSGVHYNNKQKYSQETTGLEWSDGQPWCDVFANWCYQQTGVEVPAGAKSASCAASVAAYKKAKRFTEYPVIGAQAFYGKGGGTHTGVVYDYDDTDIYTIEGNTNDDGGAEGDGVYNKRRHRRDAYVYGYGIPYLKGVLKSADPSWDGKPGGA